MHLAMRNPYKSCTGLMRLRKVDVLVFNARVETTNVLFRGRKGMMQEHMCAQILPLHTNAHGGLEPRQTVLHKVTSATLMWPTVTLMVGSNASSLEQPQHVLHKVTSDTLRCPTVTLMHRL